MKTLPFFFAVLSTALPCAAQRQPPAPLPATADEEEVAGEIASLELKMQEQQVAVEKAREAMLEEMKRNNIVDLQAVPATQPEDRPVPLSAELEALHAKAEPIQKAEFERWLDQAVLLCTEEPGFHQTYTAMLQSAADLAKLKAGGLGHRHPKVIAAEHFVKDCRGQLIAMAAQRRERLRRELLDSVKSAGTAQSPSPAAAGRANEYQKAKQEYEGALERLRRTRESAAERNK